MALYTTDFLFQVFSDEKLCYDALTQKITSIDDKVLLKKKKGLEYPNPTDRHTFSILVVGLGINLK